MKNTRKKNGNKTRTRTKKMKGGFSFNLFGKSKPIDVNENEQAIDKTKIKNKPTPKDGIASLNGIASLKDKAKNAATGAFDMLKNGFSGLTSGMTSLGHFFVHDPNAVPIPKPLSKTEIYMGTETTDYKHPLDGTNIGQINVYKKNNSVNVDSIKSADNFLSRMQEDVLNSSEKDPLLVKPPEQLYKNKDTEKRLAVFYPLSDKSKGGKSRRKTRKHKNAKLQKK
jgi:hypothetical protein